ncbi:MAG: LytTR family transcriptional regulator DNA-binding domain-containing protein [Lachnospiraceae bacterium]|nr:LytTR family transcriptional regulator DNA-binding domain-containing protein [Lachnospiraceae bacterium]
MKLYDITRELFHTSDSDEGTYINAPRHFYQLGKDASQIPIECCIGECKVVHSEGSIDRDRMKRFLRDGTKKILFKGSCHMTEGAAEELLRSEVELLGVEGKSVHSLLLDQGIIMLEGLQLLDIQEGNYFLFAPPLKRGDLDELPVRAVLLDQSETILGYEDNHIYRIKLQDIYYFESVDNKVFLYCKDKVYESRLKLYEVENLCKEYFRASKSMVLNMDAIDSVNPTISGRFCAVLCNGEKVEISRQYVPILRNMLGI